MTDDARPLIEVTGLSKSYHSGPADLPVLRNLHLAARKGEMVAIVGASGVGKTTLLHLLGGLDRFESGSVRIADIVLENLSTEALVAFRNRRIGFVFQFHHLLPEFSAVENVEMPLRIARESLSEARAHAMALLQRVGLAERLHHRPGTLSGGEQQRVAVVRALVTAPAVLLADEPTGNLDEATAGELHTLLRDMHAEHALTSIIATHNPRLAAQCDRVLRLEAGQLAPA